MERYMYGLLFTNIPHDCDESEIRNWIEARGVGLRHIRLISDFVSRTSPSFARVELLNADDTDRVARMLNGQRLNNHVLTVKALNLIEVPKTLPTMKASA
jgi:RNA recognition motif. (a.k.a. RRM, RBD, or RNP domain)